MQQLTVHTNTGPGRHIAIQQPFQVFLYGIQQSLLCRIGRPKQKGIVLSPHVKQQHEKQQQNRGPDHGRKGTPHMRFYILSGLTDTASFRLHEQDSLSF